MPPQTALTTTTTNHITQRSAPILSEKLKGLLLGGESPVVGPITAGELRTFVASAPQPELATIDDVEEHVSALALAKKEKSSSTGEAKARLELFWRVLKGCTRNDLVRGTDKLLREPSPWMPTPGELSYAVGSYRAQREYALSRAAYLIKLHEREWTPPIPPEDMVKPEDLIALSASIAEQFPSEREGENATPTASLARACDQPETTETNDAAAA
jgi:hypothetical protein